MSDEPGRWAADPLWEHGGDKPLAEIRARTADGHWHYVGDGPVRLTFRLARADEAEAPSWPADLLQDLARDAVLGDQPYAAGHLVDLGPLTSGSELTAVAFVADPELGPDHLQVVGLTEDECATALRWNAKAFLAALEQRLPLLVTDVGRGSLLADISLADEVKRGIARDGSSTGTLYVDGLDVSSQPGGMKIGLPLSAAAAVREGIEGRLPHGRALRLEDRRAAVTLVGGEAFDVVDEESDVTVELPSDVVAKLVRFLADGAAGWCEPVPGLLIRVTAWGRRRTVGT